jgi:replication factor A1
MHVNADTPEAHTLRGWYEGEGKNMSFQNHNSGGGGMSSRNAALNRDEMKTLQEVRESDLGTRDTADYFTARATIISIKHENIAYAACKGENCNKKVTDTGNGWRCEKCDQTWDKAEYRCACCQIGTHGAYGTI